jgi:antitoxin MazE
MKSRIRKWGNSLAVSIPKSLAVEAGLREGAVLDLALIEGKLVVTPRPESISLEKLLAGIVPANRHPEIDFGGPVGREWPMDWPVDGKV